MTTVRQAGNTINIERNRKRNKMKISELLIHLELKDYPLHNQAMHTTNRKYLPLLCFRFRIIQLPAICRMESLTESTIRDNLLMGNGQRLMARCM